MMYQNAIVTFIDILGFKQLVEADPTGQTINRMLDDMQREGTYEVDDIEVRTLQVSDCVIRAAWTPDGAAIPFSTAAMELLRLGLMQLNLLNKDIVIRGGVAHGPVFMEEYRFFGVAYQQAYELESKTACHPRIVVTDELVSAVRDDNVVPFAEDSEWVARELRRLVRKDYDDCYYIDYLTIHEDNFDDELDLVVFLQRHKRLIEARLVEFRGKPAESKYWWMRRYHNDYVQGLAERQLDALGVTIQELLVSTD